MRHLKARFLLNIALLAIPLAAAPALAVKER